MAIYKTFEVRGTARYQKDGRLVGKASVPQHVLKALEHTNLVDEDAEPALEQPRVCVFCEKPTKFSKFINMQTVYICEEHLNNKTTGQIVQHIREKELANG